MHVFVTGAGGFVGSEVVLRLLASGHQVSALAGSRRGRLPEGAEKRGQLTVHLGNLLDLPALPGGTEAIVHAAARSPAEGVTGGDLVRDNVMATRRLVELAQRERVRAFLLLSSLSVYGRIGDRVVDENTRVIDPDSYGETKRQAEKLVAASAGLYRSLAIRLPGVIGRGATRNWLAQVAASALAGRDITIYNEHGAFNNAVHVADLAQFCADLLVRSWSGHDAVTIGAKGQITIGEAVAIVVNALGGRSRVVVDPAPKPGFLVSSARASEAYGYEPMPIEQIVRRFAREAA